MTVCNADMLFLLSAISEKYHESKIYVIVQCVT